MLQYSTRFVIAFLLLSTVSSCSPLRRSQVFLMGNYYNTLTSYPSTIKRVNERIAKLSLEADNLNSALYPSDSLRVVGLLKAIEQFEQTLALPDSIQEKVDFLESYIRGYYLLVPNGFNIYKAFKGTTESIVGIFGLSSVASALLPDKNVEISKAKKRKVLRHFQSSRDGLKKSLLGIQDYIERHAIPMVDKTQQEIEMGIKMMFDESSESVAAREHYFVYNRHFIELFQTTIKTRKLYSNISVSVDHILAAENQIHLLTKDRQKIDREIPELHELATDVFKMKNLLQESDFK